MDCPAVSYVLTIFYELEVSSPLFKVSQTCILRESKGIFHTLFVFFTNSCKNRYVILDRIFLCQYLLSSFIESDDLIL